MSHKVKIVTLIMSLSLVAIVHGKVHPYAGLRGGMTFANTIDVEATSYGTPPMTGRGELDVSPGGNIEGAFGIGISGGIPVRVELAGGYQRNNVHGLEDIHVDGNIEIGTVIANLYFDIMDFETAYDLGPYDCPVVPYFFVGGGVALADGELEGESSTDEVGIFNMGAGASLRLNDHLWADLQYKYLVGEDMKISDSTGKAEIQLEAHQLQVGVRYMF